MATKDVATVDELVVIAAATKDRLSSTQMPMERYSGQGGPHDVLGGNCKRGPSKNSARALGASGEVFAEEVVGGQVPVNALGVVSESLLRHIDRPAK